MHSASQLLIGLIIGTLLGAAGGYYYGTQMTGQIADDAAVQVYENIETNPLKDVKTNPYDGVKLNPFE